MLENGKAKKTTRQRSPAHPYFSLKECVDWAHKLYQQNGARRVSVAVALKHMQLGLSSSTAPRALAALLGYGLLDDTGIKKDKEVWLSRLGRSIMLQGRDSSPERLEALRDAALKYKIIRDLWKKWSDGLPSDGTIKDTLLLEKRFNPRAAGRFVTVFRETYEYAALGEYAILPTAEEPHYEDDDARSADGFQMAGGAPSSQASSAMKRTTIPLIGGGEAIFEAPLPLSRRNYEHIMKWFDLMQQALVIEQEWTQGKA